MADGDRVPDAVEMSAQENVCRSTVAGWLWYCDLHDTHGNGDSEAEVRTAASAHLSYWALVDPDSDPCDLMVWQRTPHERV